MPAPGPQNPAPYLAAAERRKSYTSLFSASDSRRSDAPSTRACIRWSQCIVVGTATDSRCVCINCSMPVCPSTSCRMTRSGRVNR